MIKTIVIISTIIPYIKTPISIGILLLIQTVTSTLILSKIINSSWMRIIIFLIFVGRLLVLFLYIRRIASNEKFKPNTKIIIIFIVIILPTEELISEFQINDYIIKLKTQEIIRIIKIYNIKTITITILVFLYIFLTIIVVNFVTKIYIGPLRSK
jgi:hypothetical protein